MKIETTEIEGLLEITPKVFEDERGYFYESYNKKTFIENGVDFNFIQDNQSLSQEGVLRGLHFQAPPFAQGKLVRVIKGAVIDVAVDLRKNSPTYGRYHKVLLTEVNKRLFWVPPGFAHGFLTLEDDTIFSYKVTNIYNKESERCIKWDDEDLNLNWSLPENIELIISEKDQEGISFKDYETEFCVNNN
ncbi:MAG: dTDP-4-dehydrorhamnose 3,5-epimerase [Ichthyobacteriaceae bacterium]|nr:dTDP-4-dehydrorhamnose 3,5-epimerase [Ichthyobacteriaceae bacterium]